MGKYILYVFGLTMIGSGVGFLLISNVGVGPWDVFMANIVDVTKSSFAIAFGVQSTLLVAIGYWLRKKVPNWDIVIIIASGMYIGFLIDVVLHFVDYLSNPWIGYPALLTSLLVINIGINVIRLTKVILPSIDFFVESIHLKTGISYGRVKQLVELVVLVLGFILMVSYDLPNRIWFGTIIILIIGGPLINLTYPYVKSVVDKILKGSN